MQTITTAEHTVSFPAEYGAGAFWTLTARQIDLGPNWQDVAEGHGAEGRYGIEYAAEIETHGAGGAILNVNPDGDAYTSWSDEPVTDLQADVEREYREFWAEGVAEKFGDA